MANMRILLADDDRSLRRVLQFKLEKQGHVVGAVGDGKEAVDRLHAEPWDIVVSDIRMPNLDGIELLERVRESQPNLKVVLITAHATVSQAVQAVKLGAFDYITKPFEDEEFFAVINKATVFQNLEKENRLLKGRLQEGEEPAHLIGVSQPMKEMMQVVERIAATDATVLLTGPSGTGKELVARTIHRRSNRAKAPFIAVNCGAIPRELVESELFGHVKGAFTGAIRDKKGRFELADGGTILLDEVGDLPIDLQVNLLRVLQERVISPVGAESSKEVDVRVIAATNVDLRIRVPQGKFREDLFYRLNVIPIRVPSLAERGEDIPLLTREFVRRLADTEEIRIEPELVARLITHSWPGNVRELENLVERMVILRQSNALSVTDLPEDFGVAPGDPTSETGESLGHPTFHEAEEQLVRDALERSGWNRARAARYLNVPRHVLLYRIKKYGIEAPSSQNS
jgi:two-component system NtrC family response regulator